MERSSLHGLLAAIFLREVSAEQLNSFRSAGFVEVFSGLGIDLGPAFAHAPEDRLLEDLAVEYAALFLGPGGHISPHESAHLPDDGTLWGQASGEVKAYIEAAGFTYRADFHGIPDHIGVELEFMADLARREAIAWQDEDFTQAVNCLSYQKKFLSEHLIKWVGPFCAKVMDLAELPFYREIARLTAGFIESEQQDMNLSKKSGQHLRDY